MINLLGNSVIIYKSELKVETIEEDILSPISSGRYLGESASTA